jgi:hypothetical protein
MTAFGSDNLRLAAFSQTLPAFRSNRGAVPFHRVDNRIKVVRIGTALPVRDVMPLTW